MPTQLSPPQKANARGRAFPGPEACGPKHGIAMTTKLGCWAYRALTGAGEGPIQALPVSSATKCPKESPG